MTGNLSTFLCLSERFKEFLSSATPEVHIDLLPLKRPTDIDEDVLKEIVTENNPVGFRQKGSIFYLVAKKHPEKKLGAIDIKRKLGWLYELSENQPAVLLGNFLQFFLFLILTYSKGFLFHACGVSKNGQGYIFAGPSGSGKSTVAGLLKETTLLSDDRLCIKKKQGGYYMYGTPWGVGTNKSAKVKRVFFLKQAKETVFHMLNHSLATIEVLSNLSVGIWSQDVVEKLLATITSMTEIVSCYEMEFALSDNLGDRIADYDR